MEKLISILPVIISLISVFLTLYLSISEKNSQAKMLKKLEQKTFEDILESSDIMALGNYLDNEIGQLTISDYVENSELHKRTDVLISKLTKFIGTEEQIQKQSTDQVQEDTDSVNKAVVEQMPKLEHLGVDFEKIVQELYYGEPWNALARLRRYIEISLKKLATKHQIEVEKVNSLFQLITILHQNKIISMEDVQNLKFPIYISNRAVHGQDLKKGEAEEAIQHAALAMKSIIEKLE